MENYVLVLSSGGIDSTACINFYNKINFHIDCLFIDYGQKSCKKEFLAISKISKLYNINLITIRVKSDNSFDSGEILGRNAFFIFTALMNFKKKNGIIALGLHRGTPYYDSSKKFVDEIQCIVDRYSQGTIKIHVPFMDFNKKEIYDYCIAQKVPLDATYSCESGKKQPCGECATCKDLIEIYDSKK